MSLSRLMLITLASSLALTTQSAWSEPLTQASEIVERANIASYYAGDDGRSAARMMIVDGDNRQRRQFTLLRKDVNDGADQRYLVVFSRPADIRGTVFRVEKHVGEGRSLALFARFRSSQAHCRWR